MLLLLYDSLNLIVSGVKLWTVTGAWPQLRSTEVESSALQQLDCVERKVHRYSRPTHVLLKDKIVINDVLIASNIAEIVRYSSNTFH